MPTRSHFRKSLYVTAVVAVLLGCIEKAPPTAPRVADHLTLMVRPSLRTEARLSAVAGRVSISVWYERSSGAKITLLDSTAAVNGTDDVVPLNIDLGTCTSDPERIGAPGPCSVQVRVALLDGRGHPIDAQQFGPIVAAPGQPSVPIAASLNSRAPRTNAFREGDLLKLERVADPDSVVITLTLARGGTIAEVSLNGDNTVTTINHRLNGNTVSGVTSDSVWAPAQYGDLYGHGSPLLEMSTDSSRLYIKAALLEYNPTNKGGSATQPVPSDVVVEQWITTVSDASKAFKVRVRITHTGNDGHGVAQQELPRLYASLTRDRLASSGVAVPWTGAAPVIVPRPQDQPGQINQQIASTERWVSWIDGSNRGVTLFSPSAYPLAHGAHTNEPVTINPVYFIMPRTVGPRDVFEFEYYLIVGDLASSIATVRMLNSRLAAVPDILAPLGGWSTVTPADSASVRGSVAVSGWFVDNVAIRQIELFVDGASRGPLPYGISRLDVPNVWPGVDPNAGFSATISLAGLSPGAHTLRIEATDIAGNKADAGTRTIFVLP